MVGGESRALVSSSLKRQRYLGGPSTLMGCRRATGPGRKLLQCLAILKLNKALTLVLGSRVSVALEAVHR